MISLFMTFADPTGERRIEADDLAAASAMVGSIPAMAEGLLFTPLEQSVDHPYKADGAGPVFALQLRFLNLFACEAAMDRGGVLAGLAAGRGLPSLAGLDVTHQAMVTRAFPVDDATHANGTVTPCSYLVHYPGPADDMNAWNLHYLEHHPSIMRTFPGVRQIEIYTRIDWVDRLPSQRVEYMQRNRLMFDSPQALARALSSDVIKRMRADFVQFPPFAGGNKHFPMLTRIVRPKRSKGVN
ncbi:EthD family reductase [Bradyrhizobium sp. Pear76]|uniref:EthD family reductase n=1 Tax=Bradyrhizobium oropedii TaxID=1571201 RepID=UPI001E54BDDA|nr:EthD family reductase [Bradyrhizobium oropedii]MCC8962524.1 EthD family reductase [Bradyrhizobium oropedii]